MAESNHRDLLNFELVWPHGGEYFEVQFASYQEDNHTDGGQPAVGFGFALRHLGQSIGLFEDAVRQSGSCARDDVLR